MKQTIITIAVSVIALVLVAQLTWSIVNASNATNAKVDSIISFLNQATKTASTK